ncbi:hypothetical protein MFUL124B02_30915 [Myxococcus fulvus 124B02]|nr:hypothetical protein MFUL124B02_30915 [Myxococcus fulvus 124B02]
MSNEHRGAPVSWDELLRIKEAAEPRLFRIPGVTCVAVGPKQRGDTPTGTLSIIVYVEEKKPSRELAPEALIPPFIEGVPTDVLRMRPVVTLSGPAPSLDGNGKVLHGGVSVLSAAHDLTNGSIGCFVVKPGDPHHYFLTNQHVVLPLNDEGPLDGEVRASGMGCSSCTAARVGKVVAARVVTPVPTTLPRMEAPTLDKDYDVHVDAALVQLDPGTKWRARSVTRESVPYDVTGDDELIDLYKLYKDKNGNGIEDADEKDKAVRAQNIRVFKVGSTTDFTEGFLESVHGTFIHPVQPPKNAPTGDYSAYKITFQHQLIVRNLVTKEPFADHGDSGSALLRSDNRKVLGILWGGDPEVPQGQFARGVVSPIKTLKKLFGVVVATVTSHPGEQVAPPLGGGNAFAPESEAASAFSASAPMDTWELRAHVQAELVKTRGGQRYAQLILKHQPEVRALVETNKRVAAVWRRSGGPFIVHHLLDAARHPDEPLPSSLQGRPLDEALQDIFHILRTHGSAALVADIAEHQARFTSLLRLSYSQLLELLRTQDV